MKNQTKIGIGVLALAGVGYYFYKKNKSTMTNVSTTIVDEPKKSNFDREKESKELAVLFFSKMNKKDVKQPQTQAFLTDSKTGLQMAIAVPIKRNPITELSLYYKFLAGLNGISDDSDAEFIVNYFKKYAQAGDDRNFKPDLDTKIRLDKIQKKYPEAIKEMDFN